MNSRFPPRPDAGRRRRSLPPAPRTLLAATLAAAFASAAAAQDVGSNAADLRVNGFGTLGLVDELPHDDLGLRRDINQSARHDDHLRADIDSRLGLQAAWRLDPQVEPVGHVVLKPRAREAADDESLAWRNLGSGLAFCSPLQLREQKARPDPNANHGNR